MTPELVAQIVKATWQNPRLGVACLIGPPRGGKTHFLRELAAAEGRRTVWINPQCDAPEDVAGWPVRKGQTMTFTHPPNLPAEWLKATQAGEPGLVLVDEADKAQDAILSSLLTLLNPDERRLRWTYLAPSVGISVAMNEPMRTLPEPLVERLMYIPWPLPGSSPFNLPDLRSLSVVAAGCYHEPTIRFPQRKVTVGGLYLLKAWTQQPLFWAEEEIRCTVVRGLFPEAAAAAMLPRLQAKEMAIANPVEWAQRVSAAEAIPALLYAFREAIRQGRDAAMAFGNALEAAQKNDQSAEWQRVWELFATHPEFAKLTLPTSSDEDLAMGQAQFTELAAQQGLGVPTPEKPVKSRGKKVAKESEGA